MRDVPHKLTRYDHLYNFLKHLIRLKIGHTLSIPFHACAILYYLNREEFQIRIRMSHDHHCRSYSLLLWLIGFTFIQLQCHLNGVFLLCPRCPSIARPLILSLWYCRRCPRLLFRRLILQVRLLIRVQIQLLHHLHPLQCLLQIYKRLKFWLFRIASLSFFPFSICGNWYQFVLCRAYLQTL